MKSASGSLATLLASAKQLVMADLYTIMLIDGSTFAYTDADTNIVIGATVFAKPGLVLTRQKTRSVMGLEASTMQINLSGDSSQLLLGVPWIKAIRQGKLDGARIRVERFISADLIGSNAGTVKMFEGEVRDVDVSALTATIYVVSDVYKLDVKLPKNSYAPSCIHTLYDTGCGLNKASFAVSSAATGGTNTTITTTLPNGDEHFNLGTIRFTSGPNNGITRTISTYAAGGTFTVSLPFPVQVSAGDTFIAYPGCNKTTTTCNARFSNLANNRSYPYVPNPETIA